jgi:hypothetical protein
MNHRLADAGSKRCATARDWCARAAVAAMLSIACAAPALASALDDKARESGCIGKPEVSNGMYRCKAKSGTAFFNVPGAAPVAPSARSNAKAAASTPTPAGFPRVDTATQKGRDDVRRKVLGDELASEEKLLVEARTDYADGAPPPLPEERADAEKYRQRIARLRQAVGLHEKNIEALKKELATIK